MYNLEPAQDMELLEEGKLLGVVGPVAHDVVHHVRETAVGEVNQALAANKVFVNFLSISFSYWFVF